MYPRCYTWSVRWGFQLNQFDLNFTQCKLHEHFKSDWVIYVLRKFYNSIKYLQLMYIIIKSVSVAKIEIDLTIETCEWKGVYKDNRMCPLYGNWTGN